ncbi:MULTISPECIES: selenide, water dikinase SelD [Nitrosomonas]|uniref:Selenide, water dikinase n=2 Tax=Nitrosomonas eutropha TaxID=916 RepID=SELD_NITEC|nr:MULTISPECIES: selenide, water dikinase SelD [Nitrosomonas]Q0AFI6.1 RecName: Full=Selenide, water dikinase; AltName: Full=Selenium donor protein; AltName: Full=Selenophosphate synthase [Nitrosomonas eutropha C91]ABI59896.1 selenophosphate synthase [Nitrosomonas eutropha C91]MXS80395.1 selenide, water dikinase SelD [Nitrosomonas sp. GH22]PXV80101.1 selenophosphate synthase [Nitrosomonas eutropha]SCX21287.1 selenophosphate synthase [Nitrosomonas eutropha]SDW77426.1 selenophosphate synthase [N
MHPEKIALTQTVQKGGCAAKVAATTLHRILQQVRFPAAHSALMVDGRYFDDAAIYKINEQTALVQTLDFFTPIVDTPRLFGEIAAANAISDVYAMGGRPVTAMGILAFPLATLSEHIIVDVLQGASDKIAEAGANFVGGHSIDDDTLKFGLSVTGLVNPQQVWTNANAQSGDHLVLTKALGTGTLTAGIKRQQLQEKDIMDALESMAAINNVIDYLSPDLLAAIHAATDITGFGFSGHAMQLANASNVTLSIATGNLPRFDKAFYCLKNSFLTKAHRTNAEYTTPHIDDAKLDALYKLLIHDPQTSGGLLLSVVPEASQLVLQALRTYFKPAAIVGTVHPRQDKAVQFE